MEIGFLRERSEPLLLKIELQNLHKLDILRARLLLNAEIQNVNFATNVIFKE